jgi:hypothetical protein
MANWTDLAAAFAFGTKLTSQQQQQLRDNITALAENASGSPAVVMRDHSNMLVQWSYNGNSDTVISTSSGSYVDIFVGYFVMPSNLNNIACSINFRASTTAGDARVQLRINDADLSDEGQEVDGNWAWHHSTNVDVSGYTPGTIYKLAIRLKEQNVAVNAEIRHILIYSKE